MLRFLRNFKYYAWREVRRGCSAVAPSDRSDVHLVLPTVWPSELTKRIRPLPVPDLIEKFSCDAPGGQFATISEYLRCDPRPDAVLLPDEIDLHRKMSLDDLNSYMHAKDAFKEPQRKNRIFSHVLVVAGADSARSYPFRQRPDFLYLCDCLRPGAALVLTRSRKRRTGALLFLSQDVDSQLSTIYSHMHYVDDVLPLAMLKKSLLWLLRDLSPELWHFYEPSSPVSCIVQEVAHEAMIPMGNPRYILQYTRTVKTPRELRAVRRANASAADSMAEVIAQHYQIPQELAASFDYKCHMRHARPDVTKISCGLDGNGLWQMDAGCQYGGYEGGLARCWPSSGRFTPPQKMIYGALLDMRRDLCSLIQYAGSEGAVRTPLELHAAYLILLARHLRELRVLPKGVGSAAETVEMARRFNCSPVVVSHVGLGKRDTSRRLLDYPFAPGNVVSLRLSISIPDDCCQAYPEFRGILCQLGDTLLIRDDYSVELLTAACPSETQDIEVCLPASRTRSHRVRNDGDQSGPCDTRQLQSHGGDN
ncbi:xaa-Pro aminopeptidase 3 [Drosophila sechellia]|uniref:xaa-Pro aminopeptidase 3 n=1 Tax=Drosophila sechellia TaxID=7238 RepID=UPI0013DE5538|nr:xaa-Pro aminopeptidase 3 [Drosophila sechellia]